MAGNLDFLLNLRANTRGLDDIRNGTSQLVQSFYDATRALAQVGDASELSAESIEQMAQHGQRMLDQMNGELRVAQLELNRLSATNATPQDIENARERVSALERGIQQASSALDTYRDAARAATETSPIPSEFERDVSSLVDELDSARRSIDANGNSATHTRRQLEEMTRRASAQIDQYENDLRDARLELNRLSATNATPQDIENARARVRELERGLDQSRTALDGLNDSFRETEPAARGSFDGVNKSINGARFAVTALVGAMAALGVGLTTREILATADATQQMAARLKNATDNTSEYNLVQERLLGLANATFRPLAEAQEVYLATAGTMKSLGYNTEQILAVTESLSLSFTHNATRADQAQSAQDALSKSMAKGSVDADAWMSIITGADNVVGDLAKTTGRTQEEVRKLGASGKISISELTQALIESRDKNLELANSMENSTADAMQAVRNEVTALIGRLNEQHNVSSRLAEVIQTVGSNLEWLETLFNDAINAVDGLTESFADINPETINALKDSLQSAYEAVKSLLSTTMDISTVVIDVFNDALNAVFGFSSGLHPAGEEVSGFRKFIDLLNVSLSFLNDGFSTIGIGVNLFTGTLYGLSAAWYEFKSILTWGDVKKEALANMEAMRAKSQEYFDKGFDGVKNFESETLKSIDNIKKTEVQKNSNLIAENQKTLDQLKTQEEKYRADYRAISEERIKLNQQLVNARKASDQSAIDAANKGLAELDKKEKEYQAESQKITEAKIQAAQDIANAMIKSADAAGVAQLKVLNVKLAAQGLQAEFDSTGKIIVKAMDDGAKATEVTGEAFKTAAEKAKQAATDLKIDLYELENGITESFNASFKSISEFADGMEDLGFKGETAGNTIYKAWLKWLETAKSQNEVDLAMFKLQEFGRKGQISTNQVEMGMLALRQVIQKLPADLDPVEQAFERLGIKTKEQLALVAQNALADFNTIQSSGKATADGLRQAYERAIQAATASGDAGVIAATNAKAASLGLEVQIDSTGKASVKAMDELKDSNDRVRNSAEKIGDGYRNAGHVAREEAKSTEDAWLDAVNAASQKFDAEMKRQGKALSEGIYNYNSYSKADVISQLKSKGFDDKEAERQAGIIWSKAMEADRDAKLEGLGKGGNPALKLLIEQEFNSAAAKGLTTQHGTNRINELLKQTVGKSATSSSSTKAPKVDVNSLAPNVSTPAPSISENTTSKTSRIELVSGNKTATLTGSQQDVDVMEEMMREFEMLKRSS